MTVESTIDYEGLAQEAMRGVVRQVLLRTARSGLAGDHHFYISFDTGAPGVSLSKRLKERYPHEMTIVLQHRFWDLAVSDDRFEVKLAFDGIPERLIVPFSAIKVFFDPSVRFGLQFEDPGAGSEPRSMGGAVEGIAPRGARVGHARKSSRGSRKPQAVDKSGLQPTPPSEDAAEGAEPPSPAAGTTDSAPLAATASAEASASAEEAGHAEGSNDQAAPQKPGGAEIVSLDKFRKK